MAKFAVTLTGTNPLVVHNVQLANPFNEWARAMKEISGKRQKTDDDLRELARREFQGSLYYNDDLGPVLPSKLLFATFHNGAKLSKRGQNLIRAGLQFDAMEYKLEYPGPRDREGLWDDGNSPFVYVDAVSVNSSKVMRTRPRFENWAVRFTVELDTTELSADEFATAIGKGGSMIGIGDFRKFYGRFAAEITEL